MLTNFTEYAHMSESHGWVVFSNMSTRTSQRMRKRQNPTDGRDPKAFLQTSHTRTRQNHSDPYYSQVCWRTSQSTLIVSIAAMGMILI